MTHIEVHQMISLDNNKMNYRDPLDYNSVAYGRSLTGLAWVSAVQWHMAVAKRLAGKLEAARFGSSPK